MSGSVRLSSARYFYCLHSCMWQHWWQRVKGLLLCSQILNWQNCVVIESHYGDANHRNMLILVAEHRKQAAKSPK